MTTSTYAAGRRRHPIPFSPRRAIVAAIGLSAIASAAFAGPPDLAWSGGGHSRINATAITPNGQMLARGSTYDGTIKLWRASDATLIRTINATSAASSHSPRRPTASSSPRAPIPRSARASRR